MRFLQEWYAHCKLSPDRSGQQNLFLKNYFVHKFFIFNLKYLLDATPPAI